MYIIEESIARRRVLVVPAHTVLANYRLLLFHDVVCNNCVNKLGIA
jgi:hypothetical protein